MSVRARGRVALVGLVVAGSGCGVSNTTPADRIAEVVDPLPPDDPDDPDDAGQDEGGPHRLRFSTGVRFVSGRIDEISVGPTQLVPARLGDPGRAATLTFTTQGLAGATASIGLMPPRAAARQEVAHDTPGQPDDPRTIWIEVELAADGIHEVELPAPGPSWHARSAVVVAELRHGRARVPVRSGPRSEMVRGGERVDAGRAVLAVVPVELRPARVAALALAGRAITVDGELDEDAWSGQAARLVHSRTGEPGDDIDARVGGPTRVWFAWDDEALYVAASLADRDLYAPHGERDDPLYREEAFEVFIAADGSGARYLEHQISARDVVFDAQFRRYRKGDEDYDGQWAHAVALDGELGRRGADRGWTVELAFAWAELCAETKIECPPAAGQTIRVNVFRLDKPDRKTQVALALSPTLEPDFHAWSNAAELVLQGEGAP